MKPEYNPVEKAVECLVDEAPILVGEYGHWGERLFDWYDNYLCEYPHVWMNEIHDFIDRNELNYTAWSFHTGANPNMFMDYDTFTPSNYSGIYMKYKMLQEPETRPRKKIDSMSTHHHFRLGNILLILTIIPWTLKCMAKK